MSAAHVHALAVIFEHYRLSIAQRELLSLAWGKGSSCGHNLDSRQFSACANRFRLAEGSGEFDMPCNNAIDRHRLTAFGGPHQILNGRESYGRKLENAF